MLPLHLADTLGSRLECHILECRSDRRRAVRLPAIFGHTKSHHSLLLDVFVPINLLLYFEAPVRHPPLGW